MGELHVISALVRKRAELSGRMIALDGEKAKLRSQLNHIDNVLALFGYKDVPRDIKPIAPRSFRFKRNEVPRFIVRFEREAGEALSRRDLAFKIMAAKEWDAADFQLVRKVEASVKGAKAWKARAAKMHK
jgi:hypothetical protein